MRTFPVRWQGRSTCHSDTQSVPYDQWQCQTPSWSSIHRCGDTIRQPWWHLGDFEHGHALKSTPPSRCICLVCVAFQYFTGLTLNIEWYINGDRDWLTNAQERERERNQQTIKNQMKHTYRRGHRQHPAVCIDFRNYRPPQSDTAIHDTKVEVVDQYKHLGTTIGWCGTGTAVPHIRNVNSVFTVSENFALLTLIAPFCPFKKKQSCIQIVLIFSFMCGFGNVSQKGTNKLQRVVNISSKITALNNPLSLLCMKSRYCVKLVK